MPPKRLRSRGGSASSRPAAQLSQPDNQTAEEVENDAAMALQRELAWCLERLEAQMKNKNTSQKQMEEASRAWKNLSSARTPLVKKRQIMRSLFGDYRGTMEREERQFSLKPQNMSLMTVPAGKASKSKYFKSSTPTPATCVGSVEETTRNFQFDFSISDSNDVQPLAGEDKTGIISAEKTDNSKKDTIQKTDHPDVTAQNYYLMTESRNNGFSFNFSVD